MNPGLPVYEAEVLNIQLSDVIYLFLVIFHVMCYESVLYRRRQ
jgi:hypothetical protein